MATAGRPPALPALSAREALARKAADANVLLFGVPAGSSLLLPLLRPPCHAYAPRDDRWLQAMRAAQTVPSRRLEALRDAVQRALTCAVPPALGQKLEKTLRPLLAALEAKGTAKGDDLANPSPERLVVALQIKDRIAALLREWIADPVEGFVLRKDHVVAGLRRDDLVATPAGVGYLRAYRPKDGFCTVIYPWGHGLIHLTQVEKADVALRSQLHKRKANEFVPLEHQHLFEQVELLPSNVSSEDAIQDVEGQEESGVVELTGIDVEQYRALLASLDEDVDIAETSVEQSFVRRVQVLAAKTRELQMSKRQRLEDEEDLPEGDDQGEDEEDDGELAREEVEMKRSSDSMDVNEQQGEELQPQQQALPVEG